LISGVSAHAIFQEFYVNGVDQGHEVGIRVPDYDGPISDVTSNDIICNGGINPYHSPISQTIITVPAGSPVTIEWHHTLAGADPSDSQDPIDASHKGPIMAYLAKVDNALTSTVTGLKWFKIYEDGYNPATGKWAVDTMIANKGKVTFNMPSCIAPGNYLLRGELIALHAASSYPGAQFYMECAQINVTGGGSTSPPTVSFPGAYSGTDPGIKIDIYYPTVTSYTIPGPTVFSCGGGSGPAPTTASIKPAPTTTASTTTAPTTTKLTTTLSVVTTKPTTTPVKTTAAAPTTTAPSSGTPASAYAQCGGSGWTGSTTCVAGYTCKATNTYYSQCVPS